MDVLVSLTIYLMSVVSSLGLIWIRIAANIHIHYVFLCEHKFISFFYINAKSLIVESHDFVRFLLLL